MNCRIYTNSSKTLFPESWLTTYDYSICDRIQNSSNFIQDFDL